MVTIPILLGTERLLDRGVYIATGITLLMTSYCFLATPYLRNADNMRLQIYRCSVNVIMIFQSVLKAKFETYGEIIYVVPFIMFGILSGIAALHFAFLYIRSCQ